MRKLLLILVFLLIPNLLLADPNCPPHYQNVCKQLIQFLEKYKNGYFYKWDGTHLYIDDNFGIYDALDNDPKTHPNHHGIPGADDARYTIWNHDFFPTLLNDVVAKTQNGQQAYLHLYSFVTHQYVTGDISQTLPSKIQPPISGSKRVPLPSKIKTPVGGSKRVNSPAGKVSLQQPMPQGQNTPLTSPATTIPIKKGTQVQNRPFGVSIQSAKQNHPDKHIDKSNINDHFITYHPGSHIDHNERSYMVDSDDKVWSCKISGMGARRMKDQYGNETFFGHVETLHFQSRHIMHIPANHEPCSGCLISVHK